MTINEVRAEMAKLEKQFEVALNDLHERSGMVINADVNTTDCSEFGDAHPKVLYSVVLHAELKADYAT